MNKKTKSLTILTLLLANVIACAINIRLVKALTTIYINSSGDIVPSAVPIVSLDNITYTFTGNLTNYNLVVERESVIVDGANHSIQGTYGGAGVDIFKVPGVTVANLTIKNFDIGIQIDGPGIWGSMANITGNTIVDCVSKGIWENVYSGSNSFSGNTIINCSIGIHMEDSYESTVSGNNITANSNVGILMNGSDLDGIIGNTLSNNYDGIWIKDLSTLAQVVENNITGTILEGIVVWSSNSINVIQNTVTGGLNGVRFSGCSSATLSENNITTCSNGVVLSETQSSNLGKNNVANNNYGIYVDYYSTLNNVTENNVTANNNGGISIYLQSNNNTINHNNIISNPNQGIYANDSLYNTVAENYVKGSSAGISLNSSSNYNNILANNVTGNTNGIQLQYSSYNNLVGNNVSANSWDGIHCGACSFDYLSANNISSNGVSGIFAGTCRNTTIIKNNIAGNAFGVYFGDTSNCTIYHNNFTTNVMQQAYTQSASVDIWDNGWPSGGNYWSDYTGKDQYWGPYPPHHVGPDGIGDTPYTIDASNLDHYPLMQPWTPPDVAITALWTSKTIVFQNYTMYVYVNVTNKGNILQSFHVSAYGNDTLIRSYNVSLWPAFTGTLTVAWTATDWVKGSYVISAQADILQDEVNTADNNMTDSRIIVTMVGDLTGAPGHSVWDFVPDGTVDGSDLIVLNRCFGSWPEALPPMRWNTNCDINNDGTVDGSDLIIVTRHFGEADP
jgi:parallel beta-helix repeat protein